MVDKTGLTGEYDFTFSWASDNSAAEVVHGVAGATRLKAGTVENEISVGTLPPGRGSEWLFRGAAHGCAESGGLRCCFVTISIHGKIVGWMPWLTMPRFRHL